MITQSHYGTTTHTHTHTHKASLQSTLICGFDPSCDSWRTLHQQRSTKALISKSLDSTVQHSVLQLIYSLDVSCLLVSSPAADPLTSINHEEEEEEEALKISFFIYLSGSIHSIEAFHKCHRPELKPDMSSNSSYYISMTSSYLLQLHRSQFPTQVVMIHAGSLCISYSNRRVFLTCASTGASAYRCGGEPECATAGTRVLGFTQRLPAANGITQQHLKVKAQSWTVRRSCRLTAEKSVIGTTRHQTEEESRKQ